jgi:quercetin dioxygenase-like cupin family protein
MKRFQLADMTRGWFVGDFQPTAFATQAAEVAVKSYAAGEREARHHHRIATEITLVQSGAVEMNGERFESGAIIIIEPGESTDFHALEDTVTVVVKLPGARDDKYLGDA